MNSLDRAGLTPLINARGTFTALGVSRSPGPVRQAVDAALGSFVRIDELQALADSALARWSGAQAGAVTHCTAASITLSVAAAMTGEDAAAVARLPDTTGLRSRVVIPAPHAVDYGHPILTDIRLAGATPVLAGTAQGCSLAQLHAALDDPQAALLLLVSSRLVQAPGPDLAQAVTAARTRGVAVVIDGAAQDWRVAELVATGADAVLVSAQKYLGGATAGLVVGRAGFVQAVRAQDKGIGRAMKAGKEALAGVLAALESRAVADAPAWREAQRERVRHFVDRARAFAGLRAEALPDPTGLPFERVRLHIDRESAAGDAVALAQALRAGRPSIWVMDGEAGLGWLDLELVPLDDAEIAIILSRLQDLLARPDRAAPAS